VAFDWTLFSLKTVVTLRYFFYNYVILIAWLFYFLSIFFPFLIRLIQPTHINMKSEIFCTIQNSHKRFARVCLYGCNFWNVLYDKKVQVDFRKIDHRYYWLHRLRTAICCNIFGDHSFETQHHQTHRSHVEWMVTMLYDRCQCLKKFDRRIYSVTHNNKSITCFDLYRSCARGRQWCGIIYYHWWTASI